MSPVLYVEPIGGLAGDMFLAAALDLGVPLESLLAPLRTLGVSGWRLHVERAERHHIGGTHVDVVVEAPPEGHAHRAYRDIVALISASGLGARAKERALGVFRAIGEVEAHIHGTTLEAIHFHEVGAVDSIVDICGAAVALELLGEPTVYAAPPPLGSGTARIAHGVVPVPVPATLALLQGLPVRFEGQGERTTPTGAALLKVLATVAPPPGGMVVERIGYGVGTKDWPDVANVVRLSLGRPAQEAPLESLTLLETNLDDASPQLVAFALEQALAAGALDAWCVPAVMKKSRAAQVLSVLCRPQDAQALSALLFRETTTLGIRHLTVGREALERRRDEVQTPYGPVRVKVGLRGGVALNAAPEFDDCQAAARAHQVPLKDVQQAALAAWRARGPG